MHMHLGGVVFDERLLRTGGPVRRWRCEISGRDLDERVDRCYLLVGNLRFKSTHYMCTSRAQSGQES
jgi:hypothetical protein